MVAKGPKIHQILVPSVELGEPQSYQGGALSIPTDSGEQDIKLVAGSVVVYPASSLHQVKQVTAGERLALVIWLQSMVKEPAKRAMLYQLWQSRESLLASQPDSPDTQRIDQAYANLIRMWAEV